MFPWFMSPILTKTQVYRNFGNSEKMLNASKKWNEITKALKFLRLDSFNNIKISGNGSNVPTDIFQQTQTAWFLTCVFAHKIYDN